MEKNLPEKKFRAGGVTATIWKNKGTRNDREVEYHTVNLERSYKKDDEWKTTSSLRRTDIADAELVLRKAYEYLRLKEIAPQNGHASSNNNDSSNDGIDEEIIMLVTNDFHTLQQLLEGKNTQKKFERVIMIHDSGWGYPCTGVLVGVHDFETNRLMFREIDVKYFQDPLFSEKAYLKTKIIYISIYLINLEEIKMATEIQCIHKDIEDIKKDIHFIKDILVEDFELSEEAKRQLEAANKTPISEYIDHEEVKKQLLK